MNRGEVLRHTAPVEDHEQLVQGGRRNCVEGHASAPEFECRASARDLGCRDDLLDYRFAERMHSLDEFAIRRLPAVELNEDLTDLLHSVHAAMREMVVDD